MIKITSTYSTINKKEITNLFQLKIQKLILILFQKS